MRFNFPEPEEKLKYQESEKFEYYRYSVSCFRDLIDRTYASPSDCVLFLKNNLNLNSVEDYDVSLVDRFLKIGWNTEYLASFKFEDDQIVRVNNQWKVIQIYYAIYSVGEAAAYLLNLSSSENHRACLNKLNGFLVTSKIYPWNLAYTGCRGKSGDEHKPNNNFPNDLMLPQNNMERSCRKIDYVAYCLRATHNKRIDEYKRRKKRKDEKILPESILKYNHDPKPTTLLDYMQALRIKSNYKDAGIFMADSGYHKQFSDDLSHILRYTCYLFEMMIIKKIGLDRFESHVEKFKSINKQGATIHDRLILYKTSMGAALNG